MKAWPIVAAAVVVAGAIGLLVLFGVANDQPAPNAENAPTVAAQDAVIVTEKVPKGAASATFAGGCFWCTESAFQELPGVSNAISGYAGGTEYNPSYRDVYTESTGHREAIRVYYDPKQISYDELLDVYWRTIDPTDAGGQFVDRGMSYTTAVFYENERQRKAAERSKAALDESGRFDEPVVTEILPFTTFYQAEDYHQDFYKKSSQRYEQYSEASGREEFKERVWEAIEEGS